MLITILIILQGCSLGETVENNHEVQKAMIGETEIQLFKAGYEESTQSNDVVEDDIEEWDIALEEVKSVYINEHKTEKFPIKLTRAEWTRLLSAFNDIKKQNIYWDLTTDWLTGGLGGCFEVNLKNGEIVQIGYEPTCVLSYRGLHYFTSYHLHYYDVVRELSLKYDFEYIDLENSYMYFPGSDGYGVAVENNVIVAPMNNINDVMSILQIDGNSYDFTFEDVIYKFNDIGLNDVIELDDMLIKVIEIKDDHRVTAVAVEFKENGLTNE